MEILKYAETLYNYLQNSGIKFSSDGYPILESDMYLKELPESVIPLGYEYVARDKKKTLLVSFCNDEVIYKKLFSLNKDVKRYQQFLGFGGFDLSPRVNWDINLQRFNICVNMMANAFLGLNGVKIIPNFRSGSEETMDVLSYYPQNSWFTLGTLGCARGHVSYNQNYLRKKLIITNPDMLLVYGKLKQEYASVLDEFGIDYKVYTDYQRLCRERRWKNG